MPYEAMRLAKDVQRAAKGISPDVAHDDAARRNEVSAKLVVLGCAVRQAERCHVHPAERLFDNGVEVYQRVSVVEVRKTIMANDNIEFSVGLLLDVRVE